MNNATPVLEPFPVGIRFTSAPLGDLRLKVLRDVPGVRVSAVALAQGATVQLTALYRDNQGNPIANAGVTWSSSSRQMASVTSDGLVTGIVPGVVTISASDTLGHTATATVTVLSADSACANSSDGFPVMASGYTQTGVNHGPLQSQSVINALIGMTNGASMPERGGYIGIDINTGQYSVIELPNGYPANDAACNYMPGGGGIPNIAVNGILAVVAFHGHPDSGSVVTSANCASAPGQVALGPSGQDRISADSVISRLTSSNYVLQRGSDGTVQVFTFGSTYNVANGSTTRNADGQTWRLHGQNKCATTVY